MAPDLETVPLRARSCPGCGMTETRLRDREFRPSPDFEFIGRDVPRRSPWKWERCHRCGLLAVRECPPENWFLSRYIESGTTDPELDRRAARTAIELWERHLPATVTSVLDVGCGTGEFLALLKRRGMTVRGIEPNPSLREVSSLESGEILAPDQLSSIEGRNLESVSFQLSLEHLHDPFRTLQTIRSALVPEAFLFVLYHDARSIPHRLLGKRSPLFDVQHLQLFDSSSMRAFLERAGARVLTDRPYANAYPVSYWARLLGVQAPLFRSNRLLRLRAGNRVAVAQFQRSSNRRATF